MLIRTGTPLPLGSPLVDLFMNIGRISSERSIKRARSPYELLSKTFSCYFSCKRRSNHAEFRFPESVSRGFVELLKRVTPGPTQYQFRIAGIAIDPSICIPLDGWDVPFLHEVHTFWDPGVVEAWIINLWPANI